MVVDQGPWVHAYEHAVAVADAEDPWQQHRIPLRPCLAVGRSENQTSIADNDKMSLIEVHAFEIIIGSRVLLRPLDAIWRGQNRPAISHGNKTAVRIGDAAKNLC